MSFGYSIGDVLAVAGAIERIVGEVKSYREAPLHFRRLAIELDFLGQVCNQVFTLQPTLPEERSHIERIRAIAMHCLGPLRAFEDKMRSYDNTFGIHAAAYASGVAGGGGLLKLRKFKKRLHWSAIARHEVDELRAVLTSEILAINTLITMHEWTSLSDQGVRSEGYAKQLKQLLDTTAKASAEIQKFLTDAKLASESLERVIRTVHFTQREQIQILKTIEGKSSAVYCEAKSIRKQQKAYTKQFQEATSTQIAQIRSIKQYMEQWVKTIVEHCKRIIAMVQRNTELLLSIHSLLAKLETLLGSRVDLPSIVFENVLGIRMLLPFQLCDTWEGFNRLLGVMFYNKPGSQHVAVGKFLVMRSKTNRIIMPKDWSACVVPGDQLSMSVVMERFSARTCPRCFAVLSTSAWAQKTGITCPGCDLWLSIHRSRQAAGGVSMNDKNSPVPMPLPEKIQFRSHTSNETDWKSISVREHSLSPAHKARFRRRRIAQSSGAGPAVLTGRGSDPSTAAMDDVESFRRIHVQPYNGNFLRALFEVGENLRTLVIDMLAVDGDKNELIDEAPFADRYTDVITDFEVLRSTNISPLLEIRAKTKHMSDTKKLVMEKWVLRTAQLLFPPRRSFPIQPSTRRAIVAIEDWLQENSNCPLGYSSTVPPLSNNNPERSPEQLQMFNHYHGLINRRSHIQDSPIRAFHKIYDPGLFVSTNSWVNVNSECFDTDRKYLEDSDSDSDYDW